ncbi:MAG: hypothetical protein JJU06_13355 [Ectothiorhodospiraceae bacterium]|nr:hypothetical protein [Ectothiorhodospiraceae bacterium]
MAENNPFRAGEYNGHQTYHIDADSRLSAVRRFTLEEYRVALELHDLQKTVRTAIERRLRRLEREERNGAVSER